MDEQRAGLTERTDGELVQLACAGDKDAFGALVDRYQLFAARAALRMVGAEDVAQDLVQEALLQAYLSLPQLRQPSSFRSWLYGIVLNVSKSFLRAQKKDHAWAKADRGLPSPMETAAERDMHQLVIAAIADLPPAHRETTLLYYYDSLTVREIAAITGVSETAVKVRLYRARSQIREQLVKAYPEMERIVVRKPRRKRMVKVNVVDILMQDDKFVVVLKDEANERYLPIWIGPFEGTSIAMGLKAYPVVRPQTFDFIVTLLGALEGKLEEARIEVLKETIFYGVARLRVGDAIKEVDARPSDVLALAVRVDCPIFVSEAVMEMAAGDWQKMEELFQGTPAGKGADAILQKFEEEYKRALQAFQDKPEDPQQE